MVCLFMYICVHSDVVGSVGDLCFTFLLSNVVKNAGVWTSVRFKWWSPHSCLVVVHRVVVVVEVEVEVEVTTVWS